MITTEASTLLEKFSKNLKPGQLLETLIGSLPDTYYFIKDKKHRFIGGTDSFAVMMGSDCFSSIIGKTDFDLVPDFLASAFQTDDKKVFDSGKPLINYIELVPTKKGSLDWHCTTKVPLFDNHNKVAGLAAIVRIIDDSDTVYQHHPEMCTIVHYLRDNFPNKISMPEVAKQAGISTSTQERLFKKMFSSTPLMYLQKIRLNAACSLLKNTNASIAKIAEETGFNDHTSMTRAFRTELNITPLKFRKKYCNENT